MLTQKAILCLFTFGTVGIYMILTIYLFNKFPSLNQIWFEINDGISLIKDQRIDYSAEFDQIHSSKSDITDIDNLTNKLSLEMLQPWFRVQARLNHRKKLSTRREE